MQKSPGSWTPDRREALKAIIRDTIRSAGEMAPDQLPHHIRQRLKDQVDGTADMDRIIADVLAEENAKA